MHELKCFIDAYEWLYDVRDDFICFPSYEIDLKNKVVEMLDAYDPKSNTYGVSPMGFCSSPSDYIFDVLESKVNQQLQEVKLYIENHDMWDIAFNWGQYPEAFEDARKSWQGILAIKNYKFLVK